MSATGGRGSRGFLVVGAVLGGLSVVAGAFGAHALKEHLSADALETWRTAAHYHIAHALALVLVGVLASRAPSRLLSFAGGAFALGVALFSGSLYALALSGVRGFGAVTPFGGLFLIAGWVALAGACLRRAG